MGSWKTVVVVGGVGLFLAHTFGSATTTSRAASLTGMPQLRLNDLQCSNALGYAMVKGSVTNVSNTQLSDLVAVGTHYAADDTLVRSDSGLVASNPLMPGETSSFRTMGSYEASMAKCDVIFKEMFGGGVLTSR